MGRSKGRILRYPRVLAGWTRALARIPGQDLRGDASLMLEGSIQGSPGKGTQEPLGYLHFYLAAKKGRKHMRGVKRHQVERTGRR
jgi:hypothetical protein